MSTYLRIKTAGAVGAATIAMLGGTVAAPALAAHHHRSHHHRRHHSHIPQHNRGDRDPDNNGGRSDGDGNI
jgi:hypothetical protein